MKRLITGLLLFAGFNAQAEVKYIEDIMREALDKESDIAKVFEAIELAPIEEKQGAYKVVSADSPFTEQGIKVGDVLFAKDE